ncbi:polyprenyl synthetase family protein [Thermophilibacter provencensis]|uniref:Polyprenyl synthetase family protein n=1 Tax=Thermophilibacter provencensis TaxID=1852386 RepID=A0A921GEI9_9ACTN|nr:polyprenyl synthetase family protein [Thermophilibacter provencensis]HJF44399.1 polyprenyl synthetase family protein [Thermophilibacter provencensis]
MEELFVTYLKERLPLVERALADAADEPLADGAVSDDLVRYLYAPLRRFTASGGKRVRPVLALLGAESVGGRAEDALSCAVAVELFQSAALIHDDIADEGELRRGEPCLHRVEGTGLAINAGDLALTQVFEVILRDETLPADRRLRALSELVRMERHTLEGQALDLGWVRDARWDVTSEDYLYMVTSKTSWYSAAVPLYVGALVGGGSEEAARGLLEVGLTAGVAFQLADDLLNLVGDARAQGKDFRSDITEGKRTLAVVWALEHLDAASREELVALLGSSATDPTELARAVELIGQGGGIEHCRTLAGQMAERAKEGATGLAEAGHITVEARDLLLSMSDFFVERAS